MNNNDELTSAYIDIVTGHLHKNLNLLFQVEANYLLLEKESNSKSETIRALQMNIKDLTSSVEVLKNRETDIQDNASKASDELVEAKNKILRLENENAALIKKASHFTTATTQIKQMSEEINGHILTISDLNTQLKKRQKKAEKTLNA